MKKDKHPKLVKSSVKCSTCGMEYKITTTTDDIEIDVCANCHPFYTGNFQSIRATGRVEKFNKKLKQMKTKK